MPFKIGDHYVQCDRCGFKRLASDCRMTWDGWFVCSDTCWEEKHPSLQPQPIKPDNARAKVVRAPKEYFIEVPE